MFIHRLPPVLAAEPNLDAFVKKAQAARFSSLWVKIATGETPYRENVERNLTSLRDALGAVGIRLWGWHEPRCENVEKAKREALIVASLAQSLELSGVLIDAEKPDKNGSYFRGGQQEAAAYAATLRQALDGASLGMGLCSHDIPDNFPTFPFEEFAKHAHENVPQVYYGGSPSVANRLDRAIKANSSVALPFVPVGAGWVHGEKLEDGGCASGTACAERALAFIGLVKKHGFPAYSFWHWGGAPVELWEVLLTTPV